MPDLSVPQRFRAPLERLPALGAEKQGALLESLSAAPPLSSPRALAARITDSLGLSEDDADANVWALLSFAGQLANWPGEADELARSVANSSDLLLETEELREALAALLVGVVTSEAMLTAAKAADVITEYEHVFAGVRILTDLRPVFGDDPTVRAEGATITSTMKVDHYTDGRVRSVYVTLDRQDLEALRDSVERAIEKTDSLRSLMASIDLPLYRSESED